MDARSVNIVLGLPEVPHEPYMHKLREKDMCNDPFSRFEQQTSIMEKLAEATDPTTDRHGHDGPSQGLISKYLENLKLGTENRLSELFAGPAVRTITCTTNRRDPTFQNT